MPYELKKQYIPTVNCRRFVLASTQELHEKIHELSNRVRELEDGLRSDHIQLTNEPHPLLSEELLKIKAPLQREPPAARSLNGAIKDEESNPDVVDAFGSLSISLSGKAKFFGQTANSWVSTKCVSMIFLTFIPIILFSPAIPPSAYIQWHLDVGLKQCFFTKTERDF